MTNRGGRLRLRSENISWQDLDGAIVILDLQGSVYLELNDSGTVLWRVLAEGSDQATLARQLQEVYGVDASTAERDVTDFLDRLERAGLVERL